MKKVIFMRTVVLTIALACFLLLGIKNVRADLEVSAGVQINAASDFYDPLAANGAWVDVGAYGHCWYPGRVAADWRPYCDGSWVWTDCGWYWQSDEPWAWACYHYGSWAFDQSIGWIWIPGIEWAPAWVYWREGGGHIGWAPCGPHGAPADTSFVFVDENHFQGRHRPSDVIVNNTTIINSTTVVNANNNRESRTIDGRQQTVVVNNGPDISNIEKASGKKIEVQPIAQAASHTVAPRTINHNTVAPVENRPANQAAPVNHDQPVAVPEHNTRAVPELPDQPSPPEKRLPDEKRELNPPQSPSVPEVPLKPQPEPVPEPKHEIVPPPQVPHEVPPPHEAVPPHESPPHETQPVHPPAPQHDDDKGKDKEEHQQQ